MMAGTRHSTNHPATEVALPSLLVGVSHAASLAMHHHRIITSNC